MQRVRELHCQLEREYRGLSWDEFRALAIELNRRQTQCGQACWSAVEANLLAYCLFFKSFSEARKHCQLLQGEPPHYYAIARLNNVAMCQLLQLEPKFIETLRTAFELSERLVQPHIYLLAEDPTYCSREIVQFGVLQHNYAKGLLRLGLDEGLGRRLLAQAQVLGRRVGLRLGCQQFRPQIKQIRLAPPRQDGSSIQRLLLQIEFELGRGGQTDGRAVQETGEKADFLCVRRNVHSEVEDCLFVYANNLEEGGIEFYLANKDNLQLDSTHRVTTEVANAVLTQAEVFDFCNPQEEAVISVLPLVGISKAGGQFKLELWLKPQGLLPESEIEIRGVRYQYTLVRVASHYRLNLLNPDGKTRRVDVLPKSPPEAYLKAKDTYEHFLKYGRVPKQEVLSDCPVNVDLPGILQVLRQVNFQNTKEVRVAHKEVKSLDCFEVALLMEQNGELQVTVALFHGKSSYLDRSKAASEATICQFFRTQASHAILLRHYLCLCSLPLVLPDSLPFYGSRIKVLENHVLSVGAVSNGWRVFGFRGEVYSVEQGSRFFYLLSRELEALQLLDQIIKLVVGQLAKRSQQQLRNMDEISPLGRLLGKEHLRLPNLTNHSN